MYKKSIFFQQYTQRNPLFPDHFSFYGTERNKKMKKCIIIGGGVAGLTAGIMLQSNGWQCELLEKNTEAGGCCTGWLRNGYEIDGCIHWLTGTHPDSKLYALWKRTGVFDGVKILQPECLYASERDGQRITLWQDPERTREEMRLISPRDRTEIDRFINGIYAACGTLKNKCSVSDWAYLLHYGRACLSEVSARFQHPLLRQFLTDYFPGMLPTAALLTVAAHFSLGNAGIPEGGSRAMIQRMVQRFTSLGGILRLSTPVHEILLQGRYAVGIRTEEGEQACDAVICACDPQVTFQHLLGGRYLPPAFARRYRDPHRYPLFSAIHAAFALPSDCEIPNETTVLHNSAVFSGKAVAVRNFRTQPFFAPEGHTVVQCMSFQTERESREWLKIARDQNAYSSRKEQITEEFAQLLRTAWQCVPETLDCWTPATYAQSVGANCGAFLSFGWVNLANAFHMLPSEISGLENVFLATQWQSIPGGLPSAARAGERAAHTLLKMIEEDS